MKTRLLIIIGIIAVSTSIFTLMTYNESPDISQDSAFNYKKTEQITDETFLSKTVKEWQQIPQDQLDAYYVDYGGDDFFTDLGRLLIKNEMIQQLKKENVVNANNDFNVYPGMTLTSLPPHVSFEAVVNATDGNSYRLQGGTFANTVSSVNISKLEFFDTTEKILVESILSENQIVMILPRNENGQQVEPFDLIIDKDRHNIVGFENKQSMPMQIMDGENYDNPRWAGPIILPYGKATMTFNNTGVFEWAARSLPLPGNGWRENYGNGAINVISNDTGSLPLEEKGRIASAIIRNSEIPWQGIGTGRDGLYIDFNPAIFEMLPDAKDYYQTRAEQLIPFEILIIVEDPYSTG